MVGEHRDGPLYSSAEDVVAKLMQPSELVQPFKLFRVSQRDVVRNMVTDESFEHRVFEDGQGSSRPDRLDRLVAESFVLRRIADKVDGAIGAIEGIMVGVIVLKSSVRDDDIAPVGELDPELLSVRQQSFEVGPVVVEILALRVVTERCCWWCRTAVDSAPSRLARSREPCARDSVPPQTEWPVRSPC